MILILEIAVGIFLGLSLFFVFWRWRIRRQLQQQLERSIEQKLEGLSTDQIQMLRGVTDTAEWDRMVSNMHDMNRRLAALKRD